MAPNHRVPPLTSLLIVNAQFLKSRLKLGMKEVEKPNFLGQGLLLRRLETDEVHYSAS
jgi:hypothetical protein